MDVEPTALITIIISQECDGITSDFIAGIVIPFEGSEQSHQAYMALWIRAERYDDEMYCDKLSQYDIFSLKKSF